MKRAVTATVVCSVFAGGLWIGSCLPNSPTVIRSTTDPGIQTIQSPPAVVTRVETKIVTKVEIVKTPIPNSCLRAVEFLRETVKTEAPLGAAGAKLLLGAQNLQGDAALKNVPKLTDDIVQIRKSKDLLDDTLIARLKGVTSIDRYLAICAQELAG